MESQGGGCGFNHHKSQVLQTCTPHSEGHHKQVGVRMLKCSWQQMQFSICSSFLSPLSSLSPPFSSLFSIGMADIRIMWSRLLCLKCYIYRNNAFWLVFMHFSCQIRMISTNLRKKHRKHHIVYCFFFYEKAI